MNMPFLSRGQVEFTRSCYPPGTRIVLNSMNDPYAPVESGIRGTVRYVDDAGQVGVAGHIHLGDGCRIGAKSGVGQDVPPKQDLSGIPVMPHGSFLRASAIMPKLPEMKRRLSKLEKELAALREELANKG